MKNFLSRLTITVLVLQSITIPVASADFNDVSTSNPNATAIEYLQENGILEGYSDGTFRPNNSVNRAEFLKIILEGSNIALDENQNTPFPDVDHNAWYGPYVKKAYHEGWIVGYPDGTFKPEQTINKVESLKIIGEVQTWSLPEKVTFKPFTDVLLTDWFITYVIYAQEHNYLEETGLTFSPGNNMTRGKISEIIYRTIIENPPVEEPEDDTQEEPQDDETPEEEPEETPQEEPEPESEEEDFTPNTVSSIAANFYPGIQLESSIPNTFYKNEIFFISGSVTGNQDKVTVILDGQSNNHYQIFRGEVSGSQFNIPVYFEKSGNYNMGILPGDNGQSKAIPISVLTNLPAKDGQTSPPEKASNLDIGFANDQTSVTFNSESATLKKLTFEQGSKSFTYISRQGVDEIPIQYSDFENFSETSTTYYIESAKIESAVIPPLTVRSNFTKSSEKTFTATEHTFDIIETDRISSSNIPDTLNTGQDITITGTVLTDTKIKAFVITPDGLIDELNLTTTSPTDEYFGQPIIKSGGNFTFDYTPTQGTGRYIIEINDEGGLATLNHPIYIGNIIPLTPDYFDSNQRLLFSGSLNLNNARNELLELINDSRDEHGLDPVVLDSDLNDLAQDHSDDMVSRNFFGHVNPDNETPEDRRLNANIPTAVSENLSQDVSIVFSHLGLMRSAGHRKNILNEDWTRVGLGITLNGEGYILVAQEFSTSEITSNDLRDFKDELITEINSLRVNNNKSSLVEDSNLDSASTYLLDKQIDEGQELTNSLFTEALSENNISGVSQAIGRTFNFWTDILDSIITDEQAALLEDSWERIGADVQLDNDGNITTILIINR